MDNIESDINTVGRTKVLFDAILLLFLALLGFYIIGPIVGLLCVIPFYDGSMIELQDTLVNILGNPDGKILLIFMQGGATIGMFAIPALYNSTKFKTPLKSYIDTEYSWIAIALAVAITMTFMGFNSIIIEWNANLVLPEFLNDFQNWASEKEEMAAEMTKYLTHFDSFPQFLLGLLVIAVFPAIAEEFVFRGLLQNKLTKGFNNTHVAIWVSAFLFSAIHMQFFGFVPRMLLGALFGYLYLWSGNLIIPIVAHFINNGFTLSMIYFYNEEVLNYDIQNTETPPLSAVLLFGIITFGLLYYFYKIHLSKNNTDGGMAEGI